MNIQNENASIEQVRTELANHSEKLTIELNDHKSLFNKSIEILSESEVSRLIENMRIEAQNNLVEARDNLKAMSNECMNSFWVKIEKEQHLAKSELKSLGYRVD